MFFTAFSLVILNSCLDYVIDPKWYATRNFHGQYFSDSDKLEEYLHFRQDGIEYFFDAYKENLGATAGISKVMCKIPGGQKLMGGIMKKIFLKQALTDHGTVHFIRDNVEDHISAYWGSKKAWEALPDKLSEMKHFTHCGLKTQVRGEAYKFPQKNII